MSRRGDLALERGKSQLSPSAACMRPPLCHSGLVWKRPHHCRLASAAAASIPWTRLHRCTADHFRTSHQCFVVVPASPFSPSCSASLCVLVQASSQIWSFSTPQTGPLTGDTAPAPVHGCSPLLPVSNVQPAPVLSLLQPAF